MSLNSLFTFVSPEERRRNELEFQKKIFPLGLEQKEAALKALRPFINSKTRDSEVLYAFITAKQIYMERTENPVSGAKNQLDKLQFLSVSDKRYIMALITLEADVKLLSEYPSAEDVADAAEK